MKESNDVTQYMNNAAVYSSWFYIGTSSDIMANIMHHNVKQGLPFHGRGKFMEKIAKKSFTRRIQVICHSKFKELHPEWPNSVIFSLCAATLYHAADHYYIDKYLSFASKSKHLKKDFFHHRASLISPNKVSG